jgi:hypothetical protein
MAGGMPTKSAQADFNNVMERIICGSCFLQSKQKSYDIVVKIALSHVSG